MRTFYGCLVRIALGMGAIVPNRIARGAEDLAAAKFTVRDLQDGLRQRESLLGGIHVRFTHKNYPKNDPKDLRLHYDYELYRQGEKLYLSRDEFLPGTSTVTKKGEAAWDGQKATTYAHWLDYAKTGKEATSGTIEASQSYAFRIMALTVFEGSVFDDNNPLTTWLDHAEWKMIGMKTIAGRQVWGMENVPNHTKIVLQVWLDPGRDFAPLELTLTHFPIGPNVKTTVSTMTDVSLQQIGGIWVPKKATIRIHNPNLEEPWSEHTIDVHEYHTGLRLADDRFTIKFPPGTDLWDDIIKTSSVVGKGVWVQDPDGTFRLAAPGDVRNVPLLQDDPQTNASTQPEPPPLPGRPAASSLPDPRSSGSPTHLGLLLVASGLLAFILLAVLVQRLGLRGRRKSNEQA